MNNENQLRKEVRNLCSQYRHQGLDDTASGFDAIDLVLEHAELIDLGGALSGKQDESITRVIVLTGRHKARSRQHRVYLVDEADVKSFEQELATCGSVRTWHFSPRRPVKVKPLMLIETETAIVLLGGTLLEIFEGHVTL